MSKLLNSIIEADKKMVDEKKGVIKMAMDKKELEKEIEIANRGAEVLKERLDKVKELEERIIKVEERIMVFEKIIGDQDKMIARHDVIIGMHTGHFKEIASSLESNLSIVKENDERFRKHINNLDAHKE